jgi:hypothetical protein
MREASIAPATPARDVAAERRHGRCQGRRHTGRIFDRVLIKGVALRGVQIEHAMKLHGAPRLAMRDQRHGHARSVAACEGGDSPRSEARIRPDIIDPTRFAGPNRHAGWTLTCFRFPAELIRHGVWWYFRFCLSERHVEGLLFARGVIVTYEAIRK